MKKFIRIIISILFIFLNIRYYMKKLSYWSFYY